ncbi:hypothetical protein M0813_30009 [Anaeramoeba flamelloides]|uniref:Uncharacterized protein n=1 Tax=Anaeramoeba flamelloides TaxID=1746091 RepID=A0ABQ8XMX7_9EUKA|nr:hypothetical protein M0813_30009 [Anaeramoeba flamelloides]
MIKGRQKKKKKKNVYKPRSKIVDPIINEIGSDSSEDKTEIVNKQLSELYSLIDLEDDDEDRDKKKNTTKEIKFFSNEKNFDFEKFVTKSKNEQKQEQKFELDLDLDLDLDLEEKIEQKIKQRKQLQKPKDKDFQNQDKSNSKFKLGSKTKNKQELNLGSGSESESDSDWGELLLNIELDDKTSLDSLVSNFVGSEKKRKQTQSNYKKPNIDSNPNSIVSQDMNEKLKFDERDYLSGSNFKTNKNSTNENQKEKHKQNKNKNKDIKERPNSEFNASNMNLESLLSNFELTEKSSISNEDDEDFDEQDNLEDLFDENGELSKDFLPKYKSKDYSHLVWKESDDFSSTNINTNINSLNSTNINSESNKNPKTNTKTKTNTNTNINTNTNTKIKTKTKTKAKTKSNTKTNINSNTNPKSNPNTRIFHTKPKSKTIQPKKVNKVVKKIKHNSLGFVESFISSEGAKQINLDLMKGFEYCIIENIFQGDPEDIAKFFFSNPRIKPERIGEYLELE